MQSQIDASITLNLTLALKTLKWLTNFMELSNFSLFLGHLFDFMRVQV